MPKVLPMALRACLSLIALLTLPGCVYIATSSPAPPPTIYYAPYPPPPPDRTGPNQMPPAGVDGRPPPPIPLRPPER